MLEPIEAVILNQLSDDDVSIIDLQKDLKNIGIEITIKKIISIIEKLANDMFCEAIFPTYVNGKCIGEISRKIDNEKLYEYYYRLTDSGRIEKDKMVYAKYYKMY
jgi:DNA-binding PadR family transcriptional regulator